MKKPIISSKKKVAKARMAEVKKIPSRGLAPTDKSVARKNAASEASKIKPKGISADTGGFPDSHYGSLPRTMSGEGMGDYVEHMGVHGKRIQAAAERNSLKKRMSPIERDIKKQAMIKAYQSGSAKSTKSAPAKPMAKAKSKSMPVKKTMAKSTKK